MSEAIEGLPVERLVGPALHYATHIGTVAELFFVALDRWHAAEEAIAVADTAEEEAAAKEERNEAEEDMRERRRAINSAIYEYRKRLPEVRAALWPNTELSRVAGKEINHDD